MAGMDSGNPGALMIYVIQVLHVLSLLLAMAAGPVLVWGTALHPSSEKMDIKVEVEHDGG